MDFKLHLQPLDVGEIARLLESEEVRGQVRIAVRAEGPPEAVAVNAKLRADEGSIALQGEFNRVSAPMRYRGALDVTDLELTSVVKQATLQSDLNLHAPNRVTTSLTPVRNEAD